MPNNKPQKTFRELMSGGFFFFYEISSREYLYFGADNGNPGMEWDGTSPVPNKVIYSYKIGN